MAFGGLLIIVLAVAAVLGFGGIGGPPASPPVSAVDQPAYSIAGPHNAEHLPPHTVAGFFGAEAQSNFNGTKNWLILRCKYQSTFAGSTPKQSSKTFLQTLFGNTRPNLGHFWNAISYGKISIGATIAGGENEWRTLPKANSAYANYTESLFDLLATDCASAWDADINFANWGYVAFTLDQKVAGAAGVGGTFNIGKDGVAWQAGTLIGSWHHDTSLTGHEMGHAFNLPHSASPDDGLYNTAYDLLSAPAGNCNSYRNDYACDAGELTTFHKWWLFGWIPDTRVFVPTPGPKQVTIERESDPASATNPLLARIWVNAQTSYLVESRMSNGANSYDKQIPGNAVIITKVTTNLQGNQRWGGVSFVGTDGGNDGWWADGGSMWTATETWNSPEGISVKVDSQNASSFTVTINTPINPGNLQGLAPTPFVPPAMSINNVSVTEGSGAGLTDMNFTVTLSRAHDLNIVASYVTSTETASGSFGAAYEWEDYQGVNNGQVFFYAGETSKTLTVKVIRDSTAEPAERMRVLLYSPINATIADDTGIGTINNDDGAVVTPTDPPGGGQPSISIGNVTKLEGDPTASATRTNFGFTINLSAPSASSVTVIVSTANGTAISGIGAAIAPGDYVARSGIVVTFLPGQTGKTFTVKVKRDNAAEQSERFFVNLSGAVGATIGDGQGVGRINNDD